MVMTLSARAGLCATAGLTATQVTANAQMDALKKCFFTGRVGVEKNGKPDKTQRTKFTDFVAQRAHAAKRVLMAA